MKHKSKKEQLEELDQLITLNKFKNRAELVILVSNADENGSVPDVLKKRSKTSGSPKEKKERTPKTVYRKNAYRRWKRKGLITQEGDQEILTLGSQRYEIKIDGKEVTIVPEGQKELPLNKKNGATNGKGKKVKESKAD